MKIKRVFTSILLTNIVSGLLIISKHCIAYDHMAAVKAGISLGRSEIETQDQILSDLFALGFSTHFGYRWIQLEMNASSYINFGNADQSKHSINRSTILGDGTFRSVSFVAPVKWIFDHQLSIKKNWRPFVSFGPAVGLQTFKFETIQTLSGEYDSAHKITYESYGYVASIGFEEILPKKLRPIFVEFNYKYSWTEEASLVGGSAQKVKLITQETPPYKNREKTFLVSIGMTIF